MAGKRNDAKYPERQKATDILYHAYGPECISVGSLWGRQNAVQRISTRGAIRIPLLGPSTSEASQRFTSLFLDGVPLWFHLKKKTILTALLAR